MLGRYWKRSLNYLRRWVYECHGRVCQSNVWRTCEEVETSVRRGSWSCYDREVSATDHISYVKMVQGLVSDWAWENDPYLGGYAKWLLPINMMDIATLLATGCVVLVTLSNIPIIMSPNTRFCMFTVGRVEKWDVDEYQYLSLVYEDLIESLHFGPNTRV